MRPRISVALSRSGVLATALLCLVAACTGDDEIYATPKDAGPAGDAIASSSSSGGASSSSGGTGAQDGSTTNDAATDGGTTEAGDGGVDSGTDTGVVDSGVDSGPVVCTAVPCAGNLTCTNVGCGSCNMGLGFCKL